jgi:putative endonuclease
MNGPVSMNTRAKGRGGEDMACEHLVSLGYSIVTTNFQAREGEIDIVAKAPDGTLVFVEVKSSRGASMGNPLMWVTRGKVQKLKKIATRYLVEHDMYGKPCRFDLVGISNGTIDHIKNAFLV